MIKKKEFLDELLKRAKTYGWGGDYCEICDFIRWCFQEAGEKPPTDEELEPFPIEDE